MSRLMHWRWALLTCMLLLVCSGCTVESKEGETSVFTYEMWIPLVMIFGGALVAVGGFFLRGTWERMAWGLMILGTLGTLLIGPGMFLEYCSVGPEQFELRTGFWFYPNYHVVRYADVSSIHVTSEERRGRRGSKSKSFFLVCHLKSGGEAKVPVGDLMKDAAGLKVLQIAADRDIPIEVHDGW